MNSKDSKSWEDLFAFSDENERIEHQADMISLKIALAITDYIEEKGLSKKELATIIGTSPAYITQILRGDKRINMVFLARLTQKLNINFDFKLEETQESKKDQNPNQDNKKLINKLTKSQARVPLAQALAKHSC